MPFNQKSSSDLMPSVDNTFPMPQFLVDNKGRLNCCLRSTWMHVAGDEIDLGTTCPQTRPASDHLNVGTGRYPSTGESSRDCSHACCLWGDLGDPGMGGLQRWIGAASLIPISKGNKAKLKREVFLGTAGSSSFLPPSLNAVFSSNEGAIQSNNETLLTSQCFKCHFPFLS